MSWGRGEKILLVDDTLSSDEQETYPTTSLDENCIKFELQTERNYYVEWRQTYLALDLKFVKCRGHKSYKSKRVKKEHREEANADEETEDLKKAPSLSYCYS